MRRRTIYLPLIVMSAIVLSGCSAHPTAKWYAAAKSVRSMQEYLISAAETKQIGDEDLIKLNERLKMAEAYLWEAEKRLEDTDEFNVNVRDSDLLKLARILASIRRAYYFATDKEIPDGG